MGPEETDHIVRIIGWGGFWLALAVAVALSAGIIIRKDRRW